MIDNRWINSTVNTINPKVTIATLSAPMLLTDGKSMLILFVYPPPQNLENRRGNDPLAGGLKGHCSHLSSYTLPVHGAPGGTRTHITPDFKSGDFHQFAYEGF